MKSLKLEIPSMQSSHCQMRVSNAIKSFEGLSIHHIQSGILEITFAKEEDENAIIQAIENAGYTVVKPQQEEKETIFTFKTNINCGGCVSQVKTSLDTAEGICHWGVDTTHKDKILSVHSEGITQEEVIAIVKNAGFKIETI